MKEPKLHITSTRMLRLLEYMKDKGIAKTQAEALELIGFNPANSSKVKSGERKFTVEQIEAACKITGANANWLLGLEDSMMRNPTKKPLEMLREAFIAVETQLKKVP